jgi:hypothetical protein
MLIYGNTPRDIRRMIWRRKYKLLAILAVIAVAVMLMGCSTKPKQELKALDRFWDALGGKTTDLIDKVR